MARRASRSRLLACAFALGCATVVSLSGPAPAVAAESLGDALAETYLNNPTLRAARARLRATNERVPQELSNWRPQVSLESSIGRQSVEDEDQFNSTSDTTTPKSATLRVQQPLYRGGRTVAGTDRAEFEVKSERERLSNTEQDVLQRAVEAYLDVWQNREILRLNTENVGSLQEQLNAAKERFKRGVATKTDVAQARTRLSRARARREDTRGRLTNSRAVYEEIIGSPPGELTYPSDMAELPSNVEAAVEQAASNNPDVLAARAAGRAADRQVRQRTGRLLPTVTLSGELSRREEAIRPSDETSRAEVRVQVQVPLYQSGQVTSRVRQAKQTASQRRLETAEAKRRARQLARSAWGRLESARKTINDRRKQVEAARIALTGMEEELQVGSRTVIEVLDAEQDLFNAQISMVRARRDIAVARFGVLRAIGALTARDLELDVPLYDLQKDYEAVRGLWWSLGAPSSDVAERERRAATTASRAQDKSAPGTDENARQGDDRGDDGARRTDDAETTSEAAGKSASESPSASDGADAEGGATEAESDESDDGDRKASAPSGAPSGTPSGTGKLSVEQVREMERLLQQLDFQTGEIDGRIDPTTRAAIGQFQSVAGSEVDYVASPALLEELRAVAEDMP